MISWYDEITNDCEEPGCCLKDIANHFSCVSCVSCLNDALLSLLDHVQSARTHHRLCRSAQCVILIAVLLQSSHVSWNLSCKSLSIVWLLSYTKSTSLIKLLIVNNESYCVTGLYDCCCAYSAVTVHQHVVRLYQRYNLAFR